MNASQARNLTRQARECDLTEFNKKIDGAARDGDTSVTISIENTKFVKNFDELKKSLEAQGFSVKRDSYSDFRESYDTVIISW